MKTNTIKNLFFWIFLLFSGSLSAIPSEAEFRKLAETWTLHQDGSQEYRYYKELTLFTHTAMNSTYGQTFITYNPDFQELKIHSAYVNKRMERRSKLRTMPLSKYCLPVQRMLRPTIG